MRELFFLLFFIFVVSPDVIDGKCDGYFNTTDENGSLKYSNDQNVTSPGEICTWAFLNQPGYALVLRISFVNLFRYDGSGRSVCSSQTLSVTYEQSRRYYCSELITEKNAECFVYYDDQSTCSSSSPMEECEYGGNDTKTYVYFETGYIRHNNSQGFKVDYEYIECTKDENSLFPAMLALAGSIMLLGAAVLMLCRHRLCKSSKQELDGQGNEGQVGDHVSRTIPDPEYHSIDYGYEEIPFVSPVVTKDPNVSTRSSEPQESSGYTTCKNIEDCQPSEKDNYEEYDENYTAMKASA